MAFAYRSWSYIASTGLNSPEPQGTRLSLLVHQWTWFSSTGKAERVVDIGEHASAFTQAND